MLLHRLEFSLVLKLRMKSFGKVKHKSNLLSIYTYSIFLYKIYRLMRLKIELKMQYYIV